MFSMAFKIVMGTIGMLLVVSLPIMLVW